MKLSALALLATFFAAPAFAHPGEQIVTGCALVAYGRAQAELNVRHPYSFAVSSRQLEKSVEITFASPMLVTATNPSGGAVVTAEVNNYTDRYGKPSDYRDAFRCEIVSLSTRLLESK